jgi:hypothetical protein
VQNLALEIAGVDDVVIDDTDGAHTSGCEVERHWGAQPPSAHDQHGRPSNLFLADASYLGKHDMPAIPPDFLLRKIQLGDRRT